TAIVFASSSPHLSYSATHRMDCWSWCDVAVARTHTMQRGGNLENCLGDSNNFASVDGKPVLVAGARTARRAKAFASRRDRLPLYRLHCLQRARHYPDLCPGFDLSCLPKPGRSTGNARHDSRRLGPNK